MTVFIMLPSMLLELYFLYVTESVGWVLLIANELWVIP